MLDTPVMTLLLPVLGSVALIVATFTAYVWWKRRREEMRKGRREKEREEECKVKDELFHVLDRMHLSGKLPYRRFRMYVARYKLIELKPTLEEVKGRIRYRRGNGVNKPVEIPGEPPPYLEYKSRKTLLDALRSRVKTP